ncbi:hypothetical protein ABIA35_008353 [Catenulispora sp. MAP12-49]|uniref:DUF2795 domain-containing protein n=1 Tax=Catenulispora sp. MAP12-49 TaxID=3156302 RepID=UPI003518AF41
MTKSKKQFAGAKQQQQGPNEEFGRTIELAFVDHPWPASRADVLEHASRQRTFAKSDFARLKQIPHRDYHSVADLMDATRQTKASVAQGSGPVATAEHNRRAMGETRVDASMHEPSMHEPSMSEPSMRSEQYDQRTH